MATVVVKGLNVCTASFSDSASPVWFYMTTWFADGSV